MNRVVFSMNRAVLYTDRVHAPGARKSNAKACCVSVCLRPGLVMEILLCRRL
jgi:hypothetical protein